MSEGNGKSALYYVLRDMTNADQKMEAAAMRLQDCAMPDFESCPAGGREYHKAMADMAHAQTNGISALLQWQTIQVKREMDCAQGKVRERASDETEIKTKWFTARGVAAMWPAAIMVGLAVLYLVMEVHKR